jgi:hypothetical protein
MVRLLSCLSLTLCLAVAANAGEIGRNHEIDFQLRFGLLDVSTELESWPDGGRSKLRFDSDDQGLGTGQIIGEYRGLITPTLTVAAAFDFADDGLGDFGLTEVQFVWRPVPQSATQHRVRFGAFYPPFSLENGDAAWTSPFTLSFSAINAWLAEEIRPVGAEWSIERKLGFAGSPHSIKGFAAAFYGNDPAGTLLFWRGFGLHNRQTQLNERVLLPDLPQLGPNGDVLSLNERRLDPIAEIDDRPGFYAGAEWRYGRKASAQLAFYDNRADPETLRNGQWAWGTRFWHLAAQYELPGNIGLLGQWMRGDTDWIIGALPDGSLQSFSRLVTDEFDAAYLMLTKYFANGHRLSLRRDSYDMWRPGELDIDDGRGWTFAHQFNASKRLTVRTEWLQIESRREIWPRFFASPPSSTERLLQLQLSVSL